MSDYFFFCVRVFRRLLELEVYLFPQEFYAFKCFSFYIYIKKTEQTEI